ncbi:MAG: translocation/assembly module TamB domain-containing protein [Steroidobacteraceae bacterium]
MRRAVRIAAWSVAGLLLAAVLLVGAVLVIGNTSAGRALIERETARLTSDRVRLTGLGGTFPSDLEVARLELRDAQGVWMTAERVSLRWSPLALIGWDLHIERFQAARVDVARRPVSSPTASTQSSSATRTSLPTLDIDRIAIETLDLAPTAAGLEAQLHVEGSAHYRSLQNARARLDARRTNGRGSYAVALRLTRSRTDASLDLDEPAGGPLEHLVNLPGVGALSVSAHLEGPRNAQLLRLTARAGELRADANGTVDLVRRAADLTYSVSSPAMTPRPGFSWTRLMLKGRWQGPVSAPFADGTLDLEGLMLPDGAQLAKLAATLTANGRLLSVRANADGIMLPTSEPQLLEDSPLRVDAELRLDAPGRPLKVSLTHRLLDLTANAVTAGTRSATFDLQLPDVKPIAALYKEDLQGRMVLTGTVAERGATTGLDLTGTGRFRGSSLAARLLGANLRLQLAAALTSEAVQIQSLQVNGRALSVSASGTAERTHAGASSSAGAAGLIRTVHVRWQGMLADLSMLSRSLKGSLETRGNADGPLQSIGADVEVSSRLSVSGSPPGAVQAQLQARGLPSDPSGVVRASGTFDGAPLHLDASLERVRSNVYHVVIRRTHWKSLLANGDLTAGANLAAGRGSLQLRINSLADLQPFVGTPLAGRVAASVALTPAAARTRMQVTVDAHDLKAAGVSGNVRLSAVGPVDALRIELGARSPDIGGEPAALSGFARFDAPARSVELDSLEAHYHDQTVHLLSRPRVLFAKGLTVRNLRLGDQKAVIALDGELSPRLDLRASIHQVDAPLIDAFVPHLLAQGTFNADGELTGSRSAPVGRASLRIQGVKLANFAAEGLPALNARGTARFRGNTANVSASVDAGTGSHLRLSGRAPLNSAGTVALKLGGRMDAALMNSLLEARGEHAEGTLTIEATVKGTAHEPQIGGTILLANGDVRDYAEGIHLQNINAKLVGGKGVLTLASMTARAGTGQLSAKGTVGVLEPRMPIEIELTARGIQPITNDILTANLDSDMRVAGTLRQHIDVTGTIRIHRASINIPNGLPPSVAVLDVVRPGQARAPAPSASRLTIGLGITVDAPQAIFVQGRGLDAQLGGKLKVTGTTDSPQVNGGFSMIRGSFSLAGTNLRFTSGKVSFNGAGLKGRIDPTLDFLAEATVTSTTATTVQLHVTGFADAPKISLTSMPPLPQDDLLGLLLFGKPASQLTVVQLAETGAALASLSGIGGGGAGGGGGTLSKLNPLNWIKKALGLNTISVGGATPPGGAGAGGGTQTTGASVTAGKYISNRVYLAATQTTTGTSQVEVDVDLSSHLKLQTRLGNGSATAQGTTPQNDPGSSIGLAWQFPY